MAKYIFAASYSQQAMGGFLKDPSSDRMAAANSLASQFGGKCEKLTFTRGVYDFIAEFDLPNFEAAASIKMVTMSSGAFTEMHILEPVDITGIAGSATKGAASYKAVGK